MRSSLVLIIPILLVTIRFPSTQATDFHYCDTNVNYDVKIHTVEITPYPIARGHPATFNLSASTGKAIASGKVDIDVSYFGWHVYTESQDLCTDTLCCPIPTGDFVIAHSEVLPAYTPPGSYSLKLKIVDGNKKQLACVAFDFRVGFGSAVATYLLTDFFDVKIRLQNLH